MTSFTVPTGTIGASAVVVLGVGGGVDREHAGRAAMIIPMSAGSSASFRFRITSPISRAVDQLTNRTHGDAVSV
jgi:hypothetical protein